jgi:hypothetical protein
MTRQNGAFVYQGSGKKQAKDAPASQIECKKLACAIQYCLAKSNHMQNRCQPSIDLWKDCVDRVNAREAAKIASSTGKES